MKKFIVVLALLASSVVYAEQGDLSLYLGGYTDHMKYPTYGTPPKTANPFNYGVGLSYDVLTDLQVTTKVFNNSLNQQSTAVGIGYTFLKFHGVELNIQEQAANGYSLTYGSGKYTHKTDDMNYKTNLGICYNTAEIELFEAHNPKLCATTNIATSSTQNAQFNQVTFYLLIPLTNILE